MGKYDKLIEYLTGEIEKSKEFVANMKDAGDYQTGILNGMETMLEEVKMFTEEEFYGLKDEEEG